MVYRYIRQGFWLRGKGGKLSSSNRKLVETDSQSINQSSLLSNALPFVPVHSAALWFWPLFYAQIRQKWTMLKKWTGRRGRRLSWHTPPSILMAPSHGNVCPNLNISHTHWPEQMHAERKIGRGGRQMKRGAVPKSRNTLKSARKVARRLQSNIEVV